MLDNVIFYFFSSLAIVSSALMVTRRNAIHSAVFLITALLATAGLFLQLRAEFMFASQIILYVGGIMVLFIFVIMLVRLDVPLHHIRFSAQKLVAFLVVFALVLEVTVLLWVAGHMPARSSLMGTPAPVEKLPANSEAFADSLFNSYLLPFEIASVLLLVAMVGAVVMAKKQNPRMPAVEEGNNPQ